MNFNFRQATTHVLILSVIQKGAVQSTDLLSNRTEPTYFFLYTQFVIDPLVGNRTWSRHHFSPDSFICSDFILKRQTNKKNFTREKKVMQCLHCGYKKRWYVVSGRVWVICTASIQDAQRASANRPFNPFAKAQANQLQQLRKNFKKENLRFPHNTVNFPFFELWLHKRWYVMSSWVWVICTAIVYRTLSAHQLMGRLTLLLKPKQTASATS